MVSDDTAKVKRYTCLYTTDLKKKAKRFHDGYVRIHHFNSKLILLSSDSAQLASSFYQSKGGTSCSRLADDFVIEEREEMEFDEGFMVEIVELVFESDTNLSELRSAAREAKGKAKESARAWATSSVDRSSIASTSSATSSTPSSTKATIRAVHNGSQASVQMAVDVAQKGGYRGFGMDLLKSYEQEQAKSKSMRTVSGSATGAVVSSGPKGIVKSPYSRSISASDKPHFKSTPLSRSSASARPNHSASTDAPSASSNIRSSDQTSNASSSACSVSAYPSPMRSISSPFRPPTFNRSISLPIKAAGVPVATVKMAATIKRSLEQPKAILTPKRSEAMVDRKRKDIIDASDFSKQTAVMENDFWGSTVTRQVNRSQ